MLNPLLTVCYIVCLSCTLLQSVESNASGLAILTSSYVDAQINAVVNDNITISFTLQNATDVTWSVCCRGLQIVNSTKFIITQDLPSVSLTIINADEEDEGTYSITISNNIDTLEEQFTVNIQAFPEFLEQPLSIEEIVQEVVQLLCKARGNPVPSIMWFKDDGIPVSNDQDLSITDISGESTSSSVLVIESLSVDVAGSYYCNATNDLVVERSVFSQRAVVTALYAPDVSITPSPLLTVNVSDMTSINCSVFGIPLPNVTWVLKIDATIAVEVTSDDVGITVTEINATDSTVMSVLIFNNVSKFDEGVYTCIGSNDIDNVLGTPTNGTVSLFVQVPPTVDSITSSPIYAIEGQTITLQFDITDDDPPVQLSNITWSLISTIGEETIMNSTSLHFTLSTDKLSLTIDHVQVSAHSGTYIVTAINEAGISEASIEVIIESPPKIFRVPEDLVVLEGDDISFDCLVIGNPVPEQTWLFDNILVVEDPPRITIGEELYGTLSINNVTFEEEGIYTCIYNSTIGFIDITAQLTVQVRPTFEDITVPINSTAGDDVIMTCTSTGVPEPTITWLKDNNPISASSNDIIITTASTELVSGIISITSTLQLLGVVLDDTSNYSCKADNDLARPQTELSDEFELSILYPPDVTISNESLTVNQSTESSFTCQSFGIPVPLLSWFYNNSMDSELSNNDQFSITNTIITNSSGLDILISTLTIQNTIRSLHEGVYTCVANNDIVNLIHTPESAEIFLIVQVPPRVLIVTNNPVGVVNRSLTISFNIDQASPTVLLQNIEWHYNDSTLLNNGSQAILVDQMFSTDLLNLTLTNIQHSNQGYYSMTATNEAGTNRSEIFLQVEAAPVITVSPNNTLQLEGSNVTFQCEAISEPLYTVQWQFNETFINNNNDYMINQITGELTVFNITLTDTGIYTCIVENIHGNDSASANLSVQVVPQFLVNQIESLILLIGESLQLNCSSFAVPPSNITWLKDNNVLDTASDSSLLVVSNTEGTITFSRITITNVNFTNTGSYACRADNNLVSLQSTTSMPAIITVNMPVVILESPSDNIVNETDTIQYKCVAEGLPIPSITWSNPQIVDLLAIDSVTITDNTVGASLIESTLTFTSIMDIDANNYTCTANNTPRDNTVIVNESFSITVQTIPMVTFIGNETVIGVQLRDVQMTFNVSRDLPLVVMEDIRWFFTQQGTNTKKEILSEDQPNHYAFTNNRLTLTITLLDLTDSGTYTVEASNIVGTGNASTILDVQRAPVIIVQLLPLLQLSGTNATFICEAEAIPQHTIEWTKDGQELFNNTKILITGLGTARSVLTIIDLELSDTGSYSCFAENVHGNDSTTDELFVQVPPSFTENPLPLNLTAGGNVTIVCNATGFPEPLVTIIKDGQTLLSQFNTLNGSLSNGLIYQSVSLFLSEVTFTDTGYYSCNASNELASLQIIPSPPSIYTVQYAPNVTISPLSIIANESDSITVICHVVSLPTANIIWSNSSSNNTIITDNTIVITEQLLSDHSEIPITVSNLTITDILKVHEANYTCIASNGIDNLLSTPENGTISVIVQVPPTVIAIDDSVLGIINRSTILRFTIERASPVVDISNIQWMRLTSSSNEDITTSTDNRLIFSMDLLTLTINNISNNDEGIYTLIASNPAGIMSAAVNLSVEAPPVFIQRPQDTSVLSGETAVFPCNAISEPLHSIRWLRDDTIIGQYLSPQDRPESVNDFARLNNTVTGIPIVIDNTKYQLAGEGPLYGQLTIIDTVLDDGRMYTCIANNIHGNISASASLLVQGIQLAAIVIVLCGREYTCTCIANNIYGNISASALLLVQVTPVFTNVFNSPINTSIADNVTFACNAAGQPEPNITWYRNGIELTTNDNNIQITESSDMRQFNSSLTILQVSRAHEGEYWCNATNYLFVRFEVMSPKWTVNVNFPPDVVKGPSEILERNKAQYAVFTCQITALPAPVIQWTHTGTNNPITDLKGKYEIKNVLDDSSVVGPYSIETQLTIFNLSFTDQQTYTCTGISQVDVDNVINAQNNASASLFVNVPPRVIAITDSPSTALWDKQFIITFDITSAQPPVDPQDIIWTFEPSDNTGIVTINDTSSDRLVFTSNRQSLTITSILLSDIGKYTLTAINNGGSNTATVSINVLVEPVINSLMTSYNETTITIGNSITLTCRGDGIPTPLLTWRRNGTILTTTGRTNVTTTVINEGIRTIIPIPESVISILTVNNIKDSDDYTLLTCIVENSVGQDKEPYLLRVDQDSANDPCLSNPCLNNGTCYTMSGISLSFVCLCIDGYTGDTCGVAASPIVIIPPSILVPPQPIFNELHSLVNMTCIANGNPQPNIEWYKDGVIINEAKAFQYTFELGLNNRGFYNCKAVSNLRGGSTLNVFSDPVLVSINNIFQYLLTVSVSVNSLQDIYGNSDTLVDDYVQRINNDLMGKELINNSVIFSISLHEIVNNQSNNITFSTIITLLSDKPYREHLYTFLLNYKANPSYVLDNLIRFDGCVSEMTTFSSNNYWPETNLGFSVTLDCPCGDLSLGEGRPMASRRCDGSFTTGAQWSISNSDQCDFNSGAQSLCQVTNVPDVSIVLTMINTISEDITTETELVISIALLENRFNEIMGNISLLNQFFSVIDNILTVDKIILKSAQEIGNTSSRILEILDQSGNANSVATGLAFNQSSFSLMVYNSTSTVEDTFQLTVADTGNFSVNIKISNSAASNNSSKYIITVFPDDRLFASSADTLLASTVVGINNNDQLNQSTTMSFVTNQTLLSIGSETVCVFWDFKLNSGRGDWSSEGCYKQPNTDDRTNSVTCYCDHFTHFAVIVRISSDNNNVEDESKGASFLTGVEAIVVVASVISIVFLIVTIVLYLNAWSALDGVTAKLFINTCIALMLLHLIYIAAIYSKDGNIACIVFAALFHYSFLVAVAAILLECIFLFLRRFWEKVECYSPAIIITTWIIPALIVTFCVAPAHHLYSTNNTCRPRDTPFYLGLIAPFIIAMVLSWILLAIVLIKNKAFTIQWVQLTIISSVFSLGWIFALAVGEVVSISAATLQIIFILTGGLLGLYIFVLYCLGYSPVRRYICRMKSNDDTDLNRQVVNVADPSNSMQRLMKVINIDEQIIINSEPGSPTVNNSSNVHNDDIVVDIEMVKETNF